MDARTNCVATDPANETVAVRILDVLRDRLPELVRAPTRAFEVVLAT